MKNKLQKAILSRPLPSLVFFLIFKPETICFCVVKNLLFCFSRFWCEERKRQFEHTTIRKQNKTQKNMINRVISDVAKQGFHQYRLVYFYYTTARCKSFRFLILKLHFLKSIIKIILFLLQRVSFCQMKAQR